MQGEELKYTLALKLKIGIPNPFCKKAGTIFFKNAGNSTKKAAAK